ncbi:hypothetical protein BG53_14520 [Paenibacillus darwinianus]|uniref:DUF2621 domain-containing protein n=1 Tax=Paenibacillus darwinianus TaxID=1380763 RepID=A0A9W5S1R3_9BACL|nr:DUF2621 family protein [Paenibacillus darwinianus]EXX89655.1 hypothetical protein BG52_15000 [Paenibacillus darwinianus]EXX89971.1 hypothetical protein BG53_14520 [Paenibacillus darwinianus]EXX90231.1 hypothetical protein CH50_16010 [Paenibacillus darwinianus]
MDSWNGGFIYLIVFWAAVMVVFMSIGGFFMFRKFMKVLPMRDGKSKLDWQNYWVERSRPLWTDDSKAFLDQLVSPVPQAFRDIAKHSIAARIGQVAIESNASEVTRAHCIEGYILATPARDYRSLTIFLDKNNIDYSPYKHMLNK